MSLLAAAQASERIRFVYGVDPAGGAVARTVGQDALRVAPDLDDALSDGTLDAIVLATPHSLHRDQVLRCAEAGKHVFCEKPLALKAGDALAMIQACERRGVVLGVGHNRRFWPSLLEIKRLAESGALGQLLHVEGHNSNENSNAVLGGWRLSPEESPGGGMTGAGLHVLDAFVSLLGPVRQVQAHLVARKTDPPPVDTVSALYRFANDVSGTLATVRATPFYWRIHLFGTAGSAEAHGETEVTIRAGGRTTHESFAPVDSLRAEVDAFADGIEGRGSFPISTRQMLATVEALEATLTSMRTGQPVSPSGVS